MGTIATGPTDRGTETQSRATQTLAEEFNAKVAGNAKTQRRGTCVHEVAGSGPAEGR